MAAPREVSLYWSDHEAHRLEGVEASSVVCPKNSVLKLAAVNSSTVPYAVQVGLPTGVIPPAALVEVSTVA